MQILKGNENEVDQNVIIQGILFTKHDEEMNDIAKEEEKLPGRRGVKKRQIFAISSTLPSKESTRAYEGNIAMSPNEKLELHRNSSTTDAGTNEKVPRSSSITSPGTNNTDALSLDREDIIEFVRTHSRIYADQN